ncbi:hypothetical protein GGQ57_003007 [Parabacteroides faecis]|uniref:Uncharacterized protein n=1 Tax=Parabacteroides faecis TaxID=1217282 RepID=A0ABR6KQL9_9BACT|nr:hypothetical protein [Parabacteroides faecis]
MTLAIFNKAVTSRLRVVSSFRLYDTCTANFCVGI